MDPTTRIDGPYVDVVFFFWFLHLQNSAFVEFELRIRNIRATVAIDLYWTSTGKRLSYLFTISDTLPLVFFFLETFVNIMRVWKLLADGVYVLLETFVFLWNREI